MLKQEPMRMPVQTTGHDPVVPPNSYLHIRQKSEEQEEKEDSYFGCQVLFYVNTQVQLCTPVMSPQTPFQALHMDLLQINTAKSGGPFPSILTLPHSWERELSHKSVPQVVTGALLHGPLPQLWLEEIAPPYPSLP